MEAPTPLPSVIRFKQRLERYFADPGDILTDLLDFLQVWWPVMLWLFLVPLLLLGMEQGSDLLVGQFEDAGAQVFVRAVAVAFGLLLVGLSIVVLPMGMVGHVNRWELREAFRRDMRSIDRTAGAPDHDPGRFRNQSDYLLMGNLPMALFLAVLFVFHCRRLVPNDCETFPQTFRRFWDRTFSLEGVEQMVLVLGASLILAWTGGMVRLFIRRTGGLSKNLRKGVLLGFGFLSIAVAVYIVFSNIFPELSGYGLFLMGAASLGLATTAAVWLYFRLDEKDWGWSGTLVGIAASMAGAGILAAAIGYDWNGYPVGGEMPEGTRLFGKSWAMMWPFAAQIAFQAHLFRLLDRLLKKQNWPEPRNHKKGPTPPLVAFDPARPTAGWWDPYTACHVALVLVLTALVVGFGLVRSINFVSPVFLMHSLTAFFLMGHHFLAAWAAGDTDPIRDFFKKTGLKKLIDWIKSRPLYQKLARWLGSLPFLKNLLNWAKKHRRALFLGLAVLLAVLLLPSRFVDAPFALKVAAVVFLAIRAGALLWWKLWPKNLPDGDQQGEADRQPLKPYVIIGLLLATGLVLFVPDEKLHRAHLVASPFGENFERKGFGEYFKQWRDSLDVHPDSTAHVYLVGVQGGGSRAGFWAARILNELEVASGYRFHRHCLAISSASGGSSGAGATLALWRLADEHRLMDGRHDTLFLGFGREFYERNFLSGPMYDMAIKEPLQVFKTWKNPTNRGFRQQVEESMAFADALCWYPDFAKKMGTGVNRLGEEIKDPKSHAFHVPDRAEAEGYPFLPYLSYYYDEKSPGQLKTSLPLFFPITKNIQTGRAGFPCPLDGLGGIAPNALDLIGACDPSGRRTLPLGGAALLSQSFPIINDYQSVGQLGNFVDGGLFENHGLPALLGTYQKLNALPAAERAKLRVHLIFITNNCIENPMDTIGAPGSQASLDLSLISNGHNISGNSKLWCELVRRAFVEKGEWEAGMEFVLQKSYDRSRPKGDHVPLAKWISDHSLDVAEKEAKKQGPAIGAAVKPILPRPGSKLN